MINNVWNAFLKSWRDNGRIKFIVVACGILFSYFIVGILQEKTMRGCYGEDSKDCKNGGERFDGAVTIALAQNLLAFIIIKGLYHSRAEHFVCHRNFSDSFVFFYFSCGLYQETRQKR